MDFVDAKWAGGGIGLGPMVAMRLVAPVMRKAARW